MEITLEQCLSKLLDAYSHTYDIDRDVTVEDTVYPAMATYYLRDENYLISKQHVLSAVEQHEYVYFLLADHLTAENLQEHIDRTKAAGLAKVHPHKDHMFSNVGLVVLANSIAPEAKKLIRRTHFRKYYKLSLHGWTEYQLAAMETSTNCFFSNPAGRGARKKRESKIARKQTKKEVKK